MKNLIFQSILCFLFIIFFEFDLLAADNLQDMRVLKASETCDVEMLRDALQKGGSPNARSNEYFALELAILSQKSDCVAALISAGADANPYGHPDTWRGQKKITPIVRIFTFVEDKKNLYEMAKILIKKGDCGLGIPSYGPWSENDYFYTYPLAHLLILPNFAGKDELVDLLITNPDSVYKGKLFWETLFGAETSKQFPLLKKIVEVKGSDESWNSPNVLSFALMNELSDKDLSRSKFLLSQGIKFRWSETMDCSLDRGYEGCYQPLHQIVSAKSNFETAFEMAEILLKKGASFKDISDIEIVDNQRHKIRKSGESIRFVNNLVVLKWIMLKGYNNFRLRIESVNDLLKINPVETLKILSEYYSLQNENDSNPRDYFLSFLMEQNQIESNEFSHFFEIVKKRMAQEPNLFLESLKKAAPGTPLNKKTLDYFLSLGVEKSDFRFEAVPSMSIEDALLIKNYDADDSGVVAGRNLAETKILMKAGYSPNIYFKGYSFRPTENLWLETSGDAWMIAVHLERWDVADFIGKNGYLAKPIGAMDDTSPLIGSGIGYVISNGKTERIFKSSPEWFIKATKTYPNFSKADKSHWFIYALLKDGSAYSDSEVNSLIKIIIDQQLSLNDSILAVYNRDGELEQKTSVWVKKVKNYGHSLRYIKINLVHSIILNLDEKYIIETLNKLSGLKINFQLPSEFGNIERDSSKVKDYLVKKEYDMYAHESVKRKFVRAYYSDDFLYSKWKQFLIEYVSQGGDLNLPFYQSIEFDQSSEPDYVYYRQKQGQPTMGYHPLFINNYPLMKAYLEVAKEFQIPLDLNAFLPDWIVEKWYHKSMGWGYYCSLNPLFMNAIMPTDNVKVTELLIEYGADPNLPIPIGSCEKESILAIQYASQSGNSKVADFLKKFLKVQ